MKEVETDATAYRSHLVDAIEWLRVYHASFYGHSPENSYLIIIENRLTFMNMCARC